MHSGQPHQQIQQLTLLRLRERPKGPRRHLKRSWDKPQEHGAPLIRQIHRQAPTIIRIGKGADQPLPRQPIDDTLDRGGVQSRLTAQRVLRLRAKLGQPGQNGELGRGHLRDRI